MKRAILRVSVLLPSVLLPSVLLPIATAHAQYDDLESAEKETSTETASEYLYGVGIEAMLTAPFGPATGAAFVFDARQFRVEAIAGLIFVEDSNTAFNFGARFLWVLHSTARSDIGAGAGVGVSHLERDGPANDDTLFHLEGLVQIRVFLASNVALSGSLGLGLVAGDGDTGLLIGGQLSGIFGVAYFF
jgi:hypothetical protein